MFFRPECALPSGAGAKQPKASSVKRRGRVPALETTTDVNPGTEEVRPRQRPTGGKKGHSHFHLHETVHIHFQKGFSLLPHQVNKFKFI